ncbi:Leucine carboxyl methyltransferase 1 [Rhodotorula kratochvilovae]
MHGRHRRNATVQPVAVLLCLAGLVSVVLVLHLFSSRPPRGLPRPLVSLTSTPDRLSTSLAPTVWSLLRQSLPPEAIHVYLPRTDDGEPTDAVRARLAADEPVLAHPLVEVRFVPDEGPATKFLAVLREAFERARHSPAALEQPIVVVDDDHVYSPALVETLATAFLRHGGEAAVALRGWRVREDLQWGVVWEDVKRHVIEGWRLQDSYQVGVNTANEGYLVTPSMFLPPALRALAPPTTSSLASLSPIFSSASPAAHLVDDILLSDVLANHSVPRVVVPLRAPEPPSVDITPLQ